MKNPVLFCCICIFFYCKENYLMLEMSYQKWKLKLTYFKTEMAKRFALIRTLTLSFLPTQLSQTLL